MSDDQNIPLFYCSGKTICKRLSVKYVGDQLLNIGRPVCVVSEVDDEVELCRLLNDHAI